MAGAIFLVCSVFDLWSQMNRIGNVQFVRIAAIQIALRCRPAAKGKFVRIAVVQMTLWHCPAAIFRFEPEAFVRFAWLRGKIARSAGLGGGCNQDGNFFSAKYSYSAALNFALSLKGV